MPDSSAIDAALIGILQNDATLRSLLPDGAYMDEAPPNKQQFAVVSLVLASDLPVFGQRAIEDVLYLVKAVTLATSGSNIKAAAARIDELLDDAVLVATGYAPMTCHREERVRYVEVDPVDPSLRWQHRGGRYRVQMAVVHVGEES